MTSANAAIVGGLIGALVGINMMPPKTLNRLFKYDCTSTNHEGPRKRPAYLNVKSQAHTLIEQLIECRPVKKLQIIEITENIDKIENKNPQENSSGNSPLPIEENPDDPYNKMLVDMIKGNVKVTFEDYFKQMRKKYPKKQPNLEVDN